MGHKLIEQLVELGMTLAPGKGFSDLRDAIRYARARIKDGTIDDPVVVQNLGEMAGRAIGSVLHKQLVAPPQKMPQNPGRPRKESANNAPTK